MPWLGSYPREMQTYTHIKARRWMLRTALLMKATSDSHRNSLQRVMDKCTTHVTDDYSEVTTKLLMSTAPTVDLHAVW